MSQALSLQAGYLSPARAAFHIALSVMAGYCMLGDQVDRRALGVPPSTVLQNACLSQSHLPQ